MSLPQGGGGGIARRTANLFWVVDVSGSMAPDGNSQSVNTAVREALPHLRRTVDANPAIDLQVRVLTYAAEPRWQVAKAVPLEQFRWVDLVPEHHGLSELGLAVAELTNVLRADDFGSPPAGVVLLSDGLVTDTRPPTLGTALADLEADRTAARSIRLSVGIGRNPDLETLQRFAGRDGPAPVAASSPQELVAHLRWASTTMFQGMSELAP